MALQKKLPYIRLGEIAVWVWRDYRCGLYHQYIRGLLWLVQEMFCKELTNEWGGGGPILGILNAQISTSIKYFDVANPDKAAKVWWLMPSWSESRKKKKKKKHYVFTKPRKNFSLWMQRRCGSVSKLGENVRFSKGPTQNKKKDRVVICLLTQIKKQMGKPKTRKQDLFCRKLRRLKSHSISDFFF